MNDHRAHLKVTRRQLNTALVSGTVGFLSSKTFPAPLSCMVPSPDPAASPSPLVHKREWHVGDKDESTHVLGNGHAMVHELGPNIAYFRAPWITSPNLITVDLAAPAEIRAVSSREQGTSIWHHRLYLGSDSAGEMVDFLVEGQPAFRRTISSRVGLTFRVRGSHLVADARRYPGRTVLLGEWPYGTEIFADLKASAPFAAQLVFPSSCRIDLDAGSNQHGDSKREARIYLPPGDAEITITAGSDIPGCLAATELCLARPLRQDLAGTRQSWRSRLSHMQWIHSGNPSSLHVDAVVDDIATLLLSHQSMAGGVCARQFYPLFYVRDQYGVSRALLGLNMTDEARAILAYYYRIWQVHGRIHNAQSDGPYHWFHRAENDDVELTGYLILQAFDYLRTTHDESFVAEILPMLEWALEAQRKQLVTDMLPFNGDETYVAGGIFPRTHLNDGSSEATLLYLAASDRMLAWVADRKLWPVRKISDHAEATAAVKRSYAGNFIVNNRLTVNHPRRPDPSVLPRFRYGVCLGQYDKDCLFLTETEIADDGRYFCYSCYPKRTRDTYDARIHFIPSVALTSRLIDYQAVPRAVLSSTLADALGVFMKNGHFAWPDTTLPGYETGVVSFVLAADADPRADDFIEHMFELRDATGAWAEYYVGAEPRGCRSRPWESALSLVALLKRITQ